MIYKMRGKFNTCFSQKKMGVEFMRTLKRNISYNVACSILESNHYGVTGTKAIGKWIVFYNKDRVVARYNEDRGVLQA